MSKFPYTLGLDIGTDSVGWAVLQNDICGEPLKIERLGVRIFERAENGDGSSLAAPRRLARSARRVTRRRKHRKERIRLLLERSGLMSYQDMETLFASGDYEKSVYELRVDALDRLLTKGEVVRLLIHLAQRRGYHSNSRSEDAKDEKENGKVKQIISENRDRMVKKHYRTVGEMLWKDEKFHQVLPDGRSLLCVHNTPEEYRTTVERSMVREEIELIFDTQRKLGATWVSEDFSTQYLAIWGGQRNFDEGPGGNSPYGGNQIENRVGHCTFEPDQLRSAKATYTFEYFKLLQDINHMKLVGHGLSPVPLNDEQRAIFYKLALKSPSLTYGQLRTALGMDNGMFFNGLYYGTKSTTDQEKKKLCEMQSYHKIRQALNKVEKNAIQQLTHDQLDEIGRILTFFKSDDRRREQLLQAGIPEQFYDSLLSLSFSKAANLSVCAMKKLIPSLEQGETYDKACAAVYGTHYGASRSSQKQKLLSIADAGDIANPVVRRAISQSIKVINAIIGRYGSPEVVRVELAREMGKPYAVRDDIKKRQQNNATRNERIRNQVEEYKHDTPTGLDIVKFKLYEEQKNICLYSGCNLDLSRLFEPGYVDIDHIIPYSISFDDSYSNKVLVLSSENRQKGNRLPYGYFGQDTARWQHFETIVSNHIKSYKKRKNLLMKELPQDEGFKKRNLVDTQYLSRAVFRLINDHLLFADTGNYKENTRTQSVNGAITAEIRKRLGIEKIRADGDLHHAADATVIACVSPGMIAKITRYSQQRERFYLDKGNYLDIETGEVLSKAAFDAKYSPYFPAPWERFRKELEARLSDNPQQELDYLKLATYNSDEEILPVFVSKMPNHKVTGAAHKETIRSAKKSGYSVTKTALTNLKLDKKTGEIKNYYNMESDMLLYNALKRQLAAFGGDGKEAFTVPFYKPKADGTQGPLVKKVKIYDKSTLNVPVNGGIADNGGMVRVDVFYVKGDGYYFVPIYIADVKKKQLPNRASVAYKPYEQWKEMKLQDFCFSLYSGDLIYLRNEKGIILNPNKGSSITEKLTVKFGFFYFSGLNIATGALSITTHDRRYGQPSIGGKTLSDLQKYQVDILGDYVPVHMPETRMGFGG